jgi:hypothetical protein
MPPDVASNFGKIGGKGIRTPDFQLAKLALYQLSYAPEKKVQTADCRWQIGKSKEMGFRAG